MMTDRSGVRLIVTERIVDGRSKDDRIIDIMDSSGQLVCWAGPYTPKAAIECRELFERGVTNFEVTHGFYRRMASNRS